MHSILFFSRPILFLQPSTTDEIVNGDLVHYFVHGRDKDLFEIRRDETAYIRTTTNNNQGPWRLHYKKKLSKAVLDRAPNHIVHHHIQVKKSFSIVYLSPGPVIWK